MPAELRNLKASVALEELTKYALSMSDNETADRMQKARAAMFEAINRRQQRASA